eukprot:SAG31_NODE_13505_length_864_cov_3.376471_2_plen_128_part_00
MALDRVDADLWSTITPPRLNGLSGLLGAAGQFCCRHLCDLALYSRVQEHLDPDLGPGIMLLAPRSRACTTVSLGALSPTSIKIESSGTGTKFKIPLLIILTGVHLICNVFTHIHMTRRPTDVTRAGT